MSAPAGQRAASRLADVFGPYRVWVTTVVVLFVAYVARTTFDEPHGWRTHLAVGALCTAVSLALMGCARWVWRQDERITYVTLRAILAGAIGYHALFGVFLMLGRVKSRITSNDDFVMLAWPHVVHWINSFE